MRCDRVVGWAARARAGERRAGHRGADRSAVATVGPGGWRGAAPARTVAPLAMGAKAAATERGASVDPRAGRDRPPTRLAGGDPVPSDDGQAQRAAASSRRGSACVRVRRLGRRQDHQRSAARRGPRAGRPDSAAGDRREGRSQRRARAPTARRHRRRAVRADRPPRGGHRPLAAAVGPAGRRRGARGRTDQGLGALLLRHAPRPPGGGRGDPARRRPLAGLVPAARGRGPAAALRRAACPRPRTRRRSATARAPRGGARRMGRLR